MPLMVVKLPRDERKAWALAVAASVIFHGAVFALLPKHASYFTPKNAPSTLADAAGAETPSEPLMLSLVTEIEAPAAPEPVRTNDVRPATPDAAEVPAVPSKIAETGSGMGAEVSDAVGEPAPAGAPGEAPLGPLGEPSGMRRGVPAPVLGDALEGGRITATDVRALEPAYDSSAVEGEMGEAKKKGGGIGGFLRGVGDFLEGVEVRGGGAGGIGGGGVGGLGGHGGGGKGGGCGPKIPNIGIPGQGPVRPGGRIGVGMGGRPMGGGFRLMHGKDATAAEGRCSTR